MRFLAGKSHHSHTLWLAAIITLALAVRLSLMLFTTSWVFPGHWEYAYEAGQIAETLAKGEGFGFSGNDSNHHSLPQPTAWAPPVYPFIIAAAFRILGTYSEHAAIALELFQVIISVLTCVAVYILAAR